MPVELSASLLSIRLLVPGWLQTGKPACCRGGSQGAECPGHKRRHPGDVQCRSRTPGSYKAPQCCADLCHLQGRARAGHGDDARGVSEHAPEGRHHGMARPRPGAPRGRIGCPLSSLPGLPDHAPRHQALQRVDDQGHACQSGRHGIVQAYLQWQKQALDQSWCPWNPRIRGSRLRGKRQVRASQRRLLPGNDDRCHCYKQVSS